MENAFGKIVSILLLVFMVLVVPTKYYVEQSQAMEEMYVISRTVELVDAVRNTGYMSKDMYEQYTSQLFNLHHQYCVNMTHSRYGYINDEKITEKWYTEEIVNELYHDNIYKFEKEDYFKIIIATNNRFFYAGKNERIVSYYGGYVKNETY